MIDEQKLLAAVGTIVSRDISARIRMNLVSPKTRKDGSATLVRSTRLMRSITYKVEGKTVIVGTNVRYARILHEGGIIRPRQAQYLAVPLTPEASVRKPRDFDNTFINKGIIYKTQDAGKPVALYALKKQVTIPARPYMFVDGKTADTLRKLIHDYVVKHFRGVNDGG